MQSMIARLLSTLENPPIRYRSRDGCIYRAKAFRSLLVLVYEFPTLSWILVSCLLTIRAVALVPKHHFQYFVCTKRDIQDWETSGVS